MQSARMHVVAFAAAAALSTSALGQANNAQGQTPAAQPPPESRSQVQGQSGTAGTSGSQQQQQQQKAPDGFVIIEERVVWLLGHEPQEHFLRAIQQLGQNQPKNAAAEVRIAANYLELQSARGEGSQELKRQAQQLRDLAKQIGQGGQEFKPDQLTREFAKANLALAEHHQALAKWSLQNNQHVRAGHDLEAAATLLRQGLVWSKQEPQQETVQVIANSQEVATQLMGEDLDKGEPGQAGQSGQAGQAQPAGARQGPAGESPRTGTTPAEATNIAQHARQVCDALGNQIDQLSSKIGQGQQGQSGQSGQSGAGASGAGSAKQQQQ